MSDGGIESLCCQVQIRDKVSSDTADQESCLSGNITGNGTSGSHGSGGNHDNMEKNIIVRDGQKELFFTSIYLNVSRV